MDSKKQTFTKAEADVIIFEKNEDIVTISYTGPVSGSPVIDDDEDEG